MIPRRRGGHAGRARSHRGRAVGATFGPCARRAGCPGPLLGLGATGALRRHCAPAGQSSVVNRGWVPRRRRAARSEVGSAASPSPSPANVLRVRSRRTCAPSTRERGRLAGFIGEPFLPRRQQGARVGEQKPQGEIRGGFFFSALVPRASRTRRARTRTAPRGTESAPSRAPSPPRTAFRLSLRPPGREKPRAINRRR